MEESKSWGDTPDASVSILQHPSLVQQPADLAKVLNPSRIGLYPVHRHKFPGNIYKVITVDVGVI